jgi:hypothetical protein
MQPARNPTSLGSTAGLEAATVAELASMLEERLQKLERHQGGCPACRDAEAVAFLARMRDLLRRLR